MILFFKDDRQTFLYMVLKNYTHLEQLQRLLSRVDLRGIPSLILDDEADQAGLNTSPEDPAGLDDVPTDRACSRALFHTTPTSNTRRHRKHRC